MKRVCTNYDNCDYYEYLTIQDLQEEDSLSVYKTCIECGCLTVLVKNSTDIQQLLESETLFVLDNEEE